ncbi:MAG: acetate kinase [Clostridia bacterium]|nr:acetate kinase [Clostridia bacterium]
MKVLVINAGSSSLKYQLIDMDNESVIAKGGCERIAIEGSFLKFKYNGEDVVITEPMPTHSEAIKLVLDTLVSEKYGFIKSMDEIDAVGHRVLHAGEMFNGPVLGTEENIEKCLSIKELGPLHQVPNIAGVRACKEVMPNTPMVLVFDTTFHSTMPEKAYIFGIPYELYTEHKIRRYGFHGTSHRFVSNEAINYLGLEGKNSKIITCHLGNGSSISAVKDGKCVDTSMSFTPLGGVPMGTRSGDLDASITEFIGRKLGMDATETLNYCNKKSGMLGISGISSDFRDLRNAASEGNHRAELALDIFAYSVKKFIGSYSAALGGVDCLVFTAGIGENDGNIRRMVCEDLEYLGVEIDMDKNNEPNNGKIRDITKQGGKVKVLVIPTNEELVIARDTLKVAFGK